MRHFRLCAGTLLLASSLPAFAADTPAVPVSADNFVRAETDLYMGGVAKDGGFGKFHHNRELTPLDQQKVIRMNRDTLYSAGVFDLDAGPVTVTLPNAGKRFISLQVISEDHYTQAVIYTPGKHTFTREQIGTRYVILPVRILVNPDDPADVKQVHALQDAIKVQQKATGKFEIPHWDAVSQKKVRDALLSLADTLPDGNRMFGRKGEVDPVRRLIGSASAWGGNPQKDATYLNIIPEQNDGNTIHKLVVGKVPVDGFWSISVYNAQGYYQANPLNAYTLNSVTAQKGTDGKVTVQFGGCDGKVANCLPVMKGWNYMVRLYRPHAEVLSGKWKFPGAEAVK